MSFIPQNIDVKQFVAEIPQQEEGLEVELEIERSQLDLQSIIIFRIDESVTTTSKEGETDTEGFAGDFPYFGEYSIDKVIDAVGDAGTYQKSIVLLSILSLFAAASVSLCISFVASEPLFKCE